tara:strand:+ start:258 stop:482 length:225 start_codon:yes stop_codon:yes gene_type:complete
MAVDSDHTGGNIGPSNGEKIGLGNGDAVNAVDEYIRIGASEINDVNLDVARVIEYQRTLAQRVRAHRGEKNGGQ